MLSHRANPVNSKFRPAPGQAQMFQCALVTRIRSTLHPVRNPNRRRHGNVSMRFPRANPSTTTKSGPPWGCQSFNALCSCGSFKHRARLVEEGGNGLSMRSDRADHVNLVSSSTCTCRIRFNALSSRGYNQLIRNAFASG
jgi:hypothetical protein